MVFDPLTGRSTAAGKEAAVDDRRSKFESLPEERREAIVSAAVETFGKNDYKNASTETIARRAGISKGLLFFYFKNKKELYLYLMEHLMEKVSNLVLDDGYWEIDDFFELLVYAAETKSKVLSKFPYLLEFSIRAFYPEHKDIKDTMDSWTQRQLDFMFTTYFKNVRFDLSLIHISAPLQEGDCHGKSDTQGPFEGLGVGIGRACLGRRARRLLAQRERDRGRSKNLVAR